MKAADIILMVLGVLLALLMFIAPSKDITAYLTLILGPLLVAITVGLDRFGGEMIDVPYQNIRIVVLIGSFLPVIGMFFARFGAPFSLGFPLSFYFLISLLVILQIVFAFMIYNKPSELKN